jgi:sigma-B regulation protein RsbU (phosphoserine phosphatase)
VPSFQASIKWLGRVGIAFLILLAADLVLQFFAPVGILLAAIRLGLLITGTWLAIRLLRWTARNAVWRLRNRLLVTYLFIAVLPILLVLALAVISWFFLTQQLVVYLVASELDRRIQGLQAAANSVVRTDPAERTDLMAQMTKLFYSARYPGMDILLRQSGHLIRYPEDDSLSPPLDGWKPISGVLTRDHRLYLWCYEKTDSGDVTITAPLTSEFLAGLVPGLGLVAFGERPNGGRFGFSGVAPASRLPPAISRFDNEFTWWATIPMSDWDHPDREGNGFLSIRSRPSSVLATIFNRRTDLAQSILVTLIFIITGVFMVVEIISVVIGVTMTRTMTGAVHRLYQGTQRVTAGDFSHRIEVTGRDQLAELAQSFNQMTENMQRLLGVAQEKERLQSEIAIAREVQNQLYPRVVPQNASLRLSAVCQPARMVSGDYYDYENIRETQVALAIGDVAGKGISAALLMATLQSSLRTQLQNWLETAMSANGDGPRVVSTSHVVGHLNTQLHSYTSAEKYATFCLGVYDEPTGVLTYTNAGHLPPILVRRGESQRLDVNGTVVGAFPFSKYDESHVELQPGDLLVFFTDGISEPENEYGEMFGEDRLVDLVTHNCHLGENQIIELVLSSVRQWTASEELQDDMTIMLARRI